MSLYEVKALQPDVTVEVGWTWPAYFFQEYVTMSRQLTRSGDATTLDDLIIQTTGLVDWDSESSTVAKLVHDPWLETAHRTGRLDVAERISSALAIASAS